MRAQNLWSTLRPLVSAPATSTFSSQIRCLHKTRPPPTIPRPRPFVPDVETFLKLIGRGLSRHASKFPSWEALFTMTSPQLKELGIEPPRARRYLLQWMQRYRKGVVGPGGDFNYATELPGKGGAVVKITEGMWEQKQGRKIDGGERRRAETRFKKRSAERRAEREAELMKH
ncbi:hypothetical protein LLEC1_02175, partial [Akanthomyces lecanii]